MSLPKNDVAETYQEALRGLVNKPFCEGEKYKAQQWRAIRVGVHPDILDFERAFIRRFRKLNIPIFAHSVYRTAEQQAEIFVKGNSLAKPGSSPHNHGFAVDLIHGVKGWELSRGQWDVLGHVGKEVATQLGVELTWGGSWKTLYDPAHWEIKNWKALVSLA